MTTALPSTDASTDAELRLRSPREAERGRWQDITDRAKRLYGAVPETLRVMAIGTRTAEIYLSVSEANESSALSALEREFVAIQTARINRCHYCFSAHLARAVVLGADPESLNELGKRSFGPRIDALLAFAASVLASQGRVPDDSLAESRAAGLDDRTLVDIVATVTENLLGNTINNLARTPPEPGIQRFLAQRGITASIDEGVTKG